MRRTLRRNVPFGFELGGDQEVGVAVDRKHANSARDAGRQRAARIVPQCVEWRCDRAKHVFHAAERGAVGQAEDGTFGQSAGVGSGLRVWRGSGAAFSAIMQWYVCEYGASARAENGGEWRRRRASAEKNR